jgi:hypothetical protein
VYGTYKIPLIKDIPGIRISLEKIGKTLIYQRDCQGASQEKTVLSSGAEILVQPVEPLNLPKRICSHLLIDFASTVMIEPDSDSRVFLTFPVEIGIFITKKKKHDLLDIVSLNNQKYTLYGDPNNGIICRYHQSKIHHEIPEVDPFESGVISLRIVNKGSNWVRVNKAVFKAKGMKIYYNTDLVAMKAKMNILDDEAAETEFYNTALVKEMKKSIELFTASRLSVLSTKSVMLEGL